MKHTIDVQFASTAGSIPDEQQLQQWAAAAIQQSDPPAELSLRIVDEDEIAGLNERYRQKSGTTNVLSFPAELPPETELNLLGDVVICAPVVLAEAEAQGKALQAHWAHLVIHGVLHLQGYDHQTAEEAEKMESIEVSVLSRFGFSDPY